MKAQAASLLILVFCFSCFQKTDETGNLKTYQATGDTMVDLFTLDINPKGDSRIDEYHKYNPEIFVLTNLKESSHFSEVKSKKTGKVYKCKFNKGDIVIFPPPVFAVP